MRKGVHLIIGAVAFLVYAYLLNCIRTITVDFFILGFLAVTIGSIMPDILEPPTSSKHRRIFHSKRALKCTVGIFGLCATIGLLPLPSVSSKALIFGLSCCALGYLFHLLADSTTRRGLPE